MRPSYSKLFVRIYCLCACLAIGLAVAIGYGGEPRFSAPSFRTPRALLAWTGLPPHYVWASVFLVYGLLLILALGRHLAVHVLRVGIALYTFWALSFGGSAALDARVSVTGLVSYGVIAGLHLYLSDHLYCRGWERC